MELPRAGGHAVNAWSIRIERQGLEAEPVVVIDGFAPDPARLIDDASFLRFRPMGEHYPGVRAAVPMALLEPLLAALAPVLATTFGGSYAVADAFYSLVTTRPEALTPIQRLPHFDGVEPGRLALLHYLSAATPGGTAFYRHRSTGFETVTAARLPAYRVALAADLDRTGVPPPAYCDATSPLFEQVARYDGIANRAIIYRSHSLHCADLPPGSVFDADPARGRLTVNTFLAEQV